MTPTRILLGTIQILSSHLRLGHPRAVFPEVLYVKILKVLLPYVILASCSAHIIIYHLNLSYENVERKIKNDLQFRITLKQDLDRNTKSSLLQIPAQ